MEDLRKQLFNLAIQHGLKGCYAMLDSLRDEVKAHAHFLLAEYNVADEVKHVVNPVSTSTIEEVVKMEEVVKKVRKPRKKTVNEEPQLVNVIVEATTTNEEITDTIPLKGNAKKRWQREQEALKRLELQSKGIFKHDVLTIENLTAWIKAGRSYAGIAREEVGCTEEEVSKFCKKHNIQP